MATLIEALENKAELGEIYSLIGETEDFYDCLYVAIEFEHPFEVLKCIADKTKDFDGCVFEAIEHKYSVDVLEWLFEKSVETGADCSEEGYFDGYLLSCIKREYPGDILKWISNNTKDFKDCLVYAIAYEYPKDVLECILKKGGADFTKTDFLSIAIEYGCSMDVLEWLLEYTKDIDGPLDSAICERLPGEFIIKILDTGNSFDYEHLDTAIKYKVSDDVISAFIDNMDECIKYAIKMGYSEKIIKTMIGKKRVDPGCFKKAMNKEYSEELVILILKNENFPIEGYYKHRYGGIGWLEEAILREFSYESISYIATRVSVTESCFIAAVERGYPSDFALSLIDKISGFDTYLEEALMYKHSNKLVIFLAKHMEYSDECLGLAIENGYTSSELLDILAEKCGKLDYFIGGYEKYCDKFIENKECFICLLDFDEDEEEGIVEELECGHLVHEGCNKHPFRCPYHAQN